ncbi:MAG TPA: RecX family transcriptional regulator [Candidatus Cloacimonas sp.]|nr:RecX family transcriptional regulator [Candidatus Cloacimonas sp.]
MFLKITKKAEHDKNSLIIMDNEIRGILPDRILLTYFPLPFAGEIDGEQGKELLSLIEKNARQQLGKYVSAQEHSSVQCRQFLARKKYSAELIDTLLKEFQTKKYIDDQRYVQILIASLVERKKSKRAIILKLKETHLPTELWEGKLKEIYNSEEEKENLKEQFDKLLFRYRDLPLNKQKEKVFASLYRKGFNLDDIHTVWQENTGK